MKKMRNGKRKFQKLFKESLEKVLAKTERKTREGKIYRFFFELEKKTEKIHRFIGMDFRCDAENSFNGD